MNRTDVLGHKATDRISSFEGIITGIAYYLTGCTQYLIESRVGKSGDTKSCWFDDSRVEVSERTVELSQNGSVLQGGPQANAPRR